MITCELSLSWRNLILGVPANVVAVEPELSYASRCCVINLMNAAEVLPNHRRDPFWQTNDEQAVRLSDAGMKP